MPLVSRRSLDDAERADSQRAAATSSAASIPIGRSPRPFRFCCRRRVSRSLQASPRSARSSASTCSPRFSRSAASSAVWPRPASSSRIVAGASSLEERRLQPDAARAQPVARPEAGTRPSRRRAASCWPRARRRRSGWAGSARPASGGRARPRERTSRPADAGRDPPGEIQDRQVVGGQAHVSSSGLRSSEVASGLSVSIPGTPEHAAEEAIGLLAVVELVVVGARVAVLVPDEVGALAVELEDRRAPASRSRASPSRTGSSSCPRRCRRAAAAAAPRSAARCG